MAMSFRQLYGMIDTDRINHTPYDIKLKRKDFETDEEWKKYNEEYELDVKKSNLKYVLKEKQRICKKCNNKTKYCTCFCANCKQIGVLKCKCLPF